MKISEHVNKNNFHHAYLIEGSKGEVVPEILELMQDLKIETLGNPDFSHIELDSFKIEDARNLRSLSSERSFTEGKKIVLISANSFLLEAQNTLLKMLEEPIENTHLFLVLPDVNVLLPTFISRFYLIRTDEEVNLKEAESFLKSSPKERIDFIKELLAEAEDEEEVVLDSGRAKALKFLNSLETVLHKHVTESLLEDSFTQVLKVRQFLRQPGSSAKSLMESVALIVPKF